MRQLIVADPNGIRLAANSRISRGALAWAPMNPANFTTVGAGHTLLGRLLSSTLAMFQRLDHTSTALAGVLASELRAQPELSAWVLSLARMPRKLRAASLLRTARSLRSESETFEAADALKRMAARPAVFRAVLRELHGPAVHSVI